MPYTGAKALNLVSQGKAQDEAQKGFSKLQTEIPRSPAAAFLCLRSRTQDWFGNRRLGAVLTLPLSPWHTGTAGNFSSKK